MSYRLFLSFAPLLLIGVKHIRQLLQKNIPGVWRFFFCKPEVGRSVPVFFFGLGMTYEEKVRIILKKIDEYMQVN